MVTFFKIDELTTDLICCELEVTGLNGVSSTRIFHEEGPEWESVLRLVARLPGFDHDWWTKVVHPAFAENRTVVFRREA